MRKKETKSNFKVGWKGVGRYKGGGVMGGGWGRGIYLKYIL